MGRTALITIDMQNDFCLPDAPFRVAAALDVVPVIRRAQDGCRAAGVPVIHVIRHHAPDGSDIEFTRYQRFVENGGALVRGTPGAEILPELQPLPGERLITKQRWSAFWNTELDAVLRRLGVDQIALTGVQTPNCIRTTAYDANALGYEVIVLSDATGANSPEVHAANLFDMKNIGIQIMTTDEFLAALPNPPRVAPLAPLP